MESSQMRSWFWNKGDESLNELQGREVNGRCAVVPWLFEFQVNKSLKKPNTVTLFQKNL